MTHGRIDPAFVRTLAALAIALALAACNKSESPSAADATADASGAAPAQATAGTDGPADQGKNFPREDGDASAGKEVFRFETFGNEGFWTDAVRLPQGMVAAGVTPFQALQLGVQIDMDAIDEATRAALTEQLKADPTGATSAWLNDPKNLPVLVNANAVIGMPAKDSNGDGRIDVGHGDKAGASCALCHTITDKAMLVTSKGGSIGHRIDGPANHDLDIATIFAAAANSRALYPVLQLKLAANGDKTLGRGKAAITEASSEAEVDAYLKDKSAYPVGMFDDTFDGNGDPMHNSPLFEQDLAAPYGSEGSIAKLDNFSNLVYTSLFDQTVLTTPGGRAFLHTLGGKAGDEIADDYVKVLAATKVTGYPYVKAQPQGKPGEEANPVGLRVDNRKLLDMNAYLSSLPSPHGKAGNAEQVASGRAVFRSAGCTGCHNADQSRRVPSNMVAMKTIFPGDDPVELAKREPPLNPVMNTVDNIFDDKMAVVNASMRGDVRGIALPLLLDLARKPVFLHDNSVPNLEMLLDASRGPTAPHPFYLEGQQRADVVEFLKAQDSNAPPSG
jgi:cytochrome c2